MCNDIRIYIFVRILKCIYTIFIRRKIKKCLFKEKSHLVIKDQTKKSKASAYFLISARLRFIFESLKKIKRHSKKNNATYVFISESFRYRLKVKTHFHMVGALRVHFADAYVRIREIL